VLLVGTLLASLASATLAQPESGPNIIKDEDLTAKIPWYLAYSVDTQEKGRAVYCAGPSVEKPYLMSGTYTVAPLGPGNEPAFAWRPPDGNSLALIAEAGNTNTVVLSDGSSGRTAELTTGISGQCYGPAWSATGKYLSVVTRGGAGVSVYVIDVASSEATEVASGGVARAVWAPTGDKLAVEAVNGVLVWSPGDDKASVVPGTGSVQGSLMWSHNGELVAFSGLRADGSKGIIVARPSTGTSTEVGSVADLQLAAMSPSADELLAVAPGPDGALRLYRFAAPWRDGQDLTALLGAGYSVPQPEHPYGVLAGYSPNGSNVCFVARPADSELARYLYIMSRGGAPKCVSEPIGVQGFKWAHGTDDLAFNGRRGSIGKLSQSLFKVAAGTDQYERLTTNVQWYDWEPSGSCVAITATMSRSLVTALGVVDAGTGTTQWVDTGVTGFEWCPR